MKIIGMTGKARSGKDTLANWLINNNNDSYGYSLADPIKKAASEMFGIHIDDFYNSNMKEEPNEFWGISPREIVQKMGTEVGREMFFDDMWLQRCDMEINRLCDITTIKGLFVIRDCRFENEADYVRKRGGSMIHIIRESLGDGVVRQHVSEKGIAFKDGDVKIYNNGSIDDLYKRGQDALNMISFS